MSDDTPAPSPADDAPAPAPTLRRICCVAAPQRCAPTLADQLRAAAAWAQILQGAAATRASTQAEVVHIAVRVRTRYKHQVEVGRLALEQAGAACAASAPYGGDVAHAYPPYEAIK